MKFGDGVERILNDDNCHPTDNLLQEAQKINEIVLKNLSKVENGRPDCFLYYITTGVWNENNNLTDRIRSLEKHLRDTSLFNLVTFEPIDRDKLITLWNQTKAPINTTFEVKNYFPLSNIQYVGEAYLVTTTAYEFVQNVLTDSEGNLRWSIFQQNVRSFLGDDNQVNSSIRSAIVNKDEHAQFVLLNNGLTIVSPDVKTQGLKISLTDFQIVNGCQTSHVLFRNKGYLTDDVRILVKIIETDNPNILAQIVEATNSQSSVASSQFLSIRPFVQKIEKYFDSYDNEEEQDRRLYFERRTRHFADRTIGRYRIFDIEKLARVYAAMFLDCPHLACRYPRQILQEMSDKIYQDGQKEIAYYASALAYYRLMLALGNSYVAPEYRLYHWHILMVLRYQLCGTQAIKPNSKSIEQASNKIIAALKQGGKQSTPPFIQAIEVIKEVGLVSIDRLKRQQYTQELKSYLEMKPSAN